MVQTFAPASVKQRPPQCQLIFFIGLQLIFSLSFLQAQKNAGPSRFVQDSGTLELGKSIDRELASGEVHAYQIALATDQYLQLTVKPRGMMVRIGLWSPNGKPLVEAQSRKGDQETANVWWVADTSGGHRLEIRVLEKEATSGRYQVRLETLRAATASDRSRMRAREAFAEAEKLQQAGTAESLRKAIGKFEEALPLWRAAGDLPGEAETAGKISEIHLMLGEFQNALARLELTLSLFRAVPDTEKVAHTLANMGYGYDNLGEKPKAIAHYGRALEILRATGDDLGAAATLSNLGLLYQSIGELQKALEHYFQALPITRALNERFGEATVLNGIGAVYTRLRETDKAFDYLSQALQGWKEVKNAWGEAATLNNLGYNFEREQETQKALDCFDQALQRWREIGNSGGEAGTLTNIGRLYDKAGQKQRALDSLGKALTLYQKIKNPDGIANALTAIGNVHYALKDLPQAVEYYQRALALVRTLGDRDGEANILHGLARVERDRGQLSAAHEHIETALQLREAIRGEVAGQEVRAAYLASFQSYYMLYLDILMQQHHDHPTAGWDAMALHVSERARARSLVEILAEARAGIRRGADSLLLARAYELQLRLNTKEQQRMQLLGRQAPDAQLAAAGKEIGELLTQYQEVQAQIRTSSPSYAALTQPQPLRLREMQQQVLDEDTMLLEYALGEHRSFLWTVTPATLNSFVLPKRAVIDSVARRVYDLLTARNQIRPNETEEQKEKRLAQADHDLAAAMAGLSQMVLEPAAGLLGNKRLLIISDGALQYVPFGALPLPQRPVNSEPSSVKSKPPADNNDTKQPITDYWSLNAGYRPLAIDHEIVYLPSASVLAVLRHELATRQPAAKTIAVLADPVFAGDDLRVRRGREKLSTPAADSTLIAATPVWENALVRSAGETGMAGDNLPRLLFSRREAEGIMKLVPPGEGKKAVDFAANRATVTNPELGRYRLVHFATHGLLNNKQPELSGIVLSLVDEQGRPQDGFLRLHEIYNLNLPADLVVLSACQTALGKEIKGEGLIGLTRGFMYAGAARVVASLWNVQDKATAELMKKFYEKMLGREKLRPAAALRAAQAEMMQAKLWRAPYYWASFVLQGEWN